MSSTFRSLKYHNARLFFAGLAVSNVGTWLQMTAMSLLVYRLTGEATVGRHQRGAASSCRCCCSARGPVSSPTPTTSARWRSSPRAALAAQALLLGVLDLAGLVDAPGRLRAVAGARRGRRVRQPGATRPRDRAGPDGRHPERDVAEHGGDDGLADLRSGDGCRRSSPRSEPPGASSSTGITFFAIIFSLVAIRRDEMFPMPRRPKGGKPIREALRFVAGRRDMAIIYSLLRHHLDAVAFNQAVVLPEARRRAMGRRGSVRLRARGDVGRVAHRLVADRPTSRA